MQPQPTATVPGWSTLKQTAQPSTDIVANSKFVSSRNCSLFWTKSWSKPFCEILATQNRCKSWWISIYMIFPKKNSMLQSASNPMILSHPTSPLLPATSHAQPWKHQSYHQYRYTNPFVRWQAITNSWGNILFWHPSGTFCQLWFPGLRPSQGTQNNLFDKLLLGANIRCIHRQLQKKYAHVQLTGGDNKKAFLTIFNEAIWGVMPPSQQNWLVGQTQVAVTPPKHKAHLPPTHARTPSLHHPNFVNKTCKNYSAHGDHNLLLDYIHAQTNSSSLYTWHAINLAAITYYIYDTNYW